MSQVRGTFVSLSLIRERVALAGKVVCFLYDDCPSKHHLVIATFKIQGSVVGDETEKLKQIISEGRVVKPLYVYVDSGGFQLQTGKASSIPEGVVNAAVSLADALGKNGVVYMTLLDYPATKIGISNEEFERRLAKTVGYYSRQLDYYFKGGVERSNIRVMMPIHGNNPVRIAEFTRAASQMIRDYGITGFALTGIDGQKFTDEQWLDNSLERLSAVVRGVMDAGGKILDMHFLGFFAKRLWYAGAIAEHSGYRTVTADSTALVAYRKRFEFLLPSIPKLIAFKGIRKHGALPCNCPACSLAEEAGIVREAIAGTKPYSFLIFLHNLYVYLNFSKLAFSYPAIGFEKMGIDYDAFSEKVRMALRGEYVSLKRRGGLLDYIGGDRS